MIRRSNKLQPAGQFRTLVGYVSRCDRPKITNDAVANVIPHLPHATWVWDWSMSCHLGTTMYSMYFEIIGQRGGNVLPDDLWDTSEMQADEQRRLSSIESGAYERNDQCMSH